MLQGHREVQTVKISHTLYDISQQDFTKGGAFRALQPKKNVVTTLMVPTKPENNVPAIACEGLTVCWDRREKNISSSRFAKTNKFYC